MTSTAVGTLQERARTALADARAENDRQTVAREKYEDERHREDLLWEIKRRVGIEVPPTYVQRDPALEGREAYTVTVDGLRFRSGRDYGQDTLEVMLPCTKCPEPVWRGIQSLTDLGYLLETGASHSVCPEEARRQEAIEEQLEQAPPPPRKRTTGEQLEDVIRAIAADVYEGFREGAL